MQNFKLVGGETYSQSRLHAYMPRFIHPFILDVGFGTCVRRHAASLAFPGHRQALAAV
jgi:hypothetical protein